MVGPPSDFQNQVAVFVFNSKRRRYGVRWSSDWPVYVLLIAFVSFFIYVFIHSKVEERKDKEKESDKNKIR